LAEQAQATGTLTDEFTDISGQFNGVDQRRVPSTAYVFGYPYPDLTQARISALRAAQSLRRFVPDSPAEAGLMYRLAALVEIYFAENMCSGVPLTSLASDGTPMLGATVSRSQLIQRALAHLDSASVFTPTGDTGVDIIAVSRARALADSGDLASASHAIAGITAVFNVSPPYDGVNQINALYQDIVQDLQLSVDDHEGSNGLPFRSTNDPRLPLANLGIGADGLDSVYAPSLLTSGATPVVEATSIEVELVRAEAMLNHIGAPTTHAWLDTLNALRTSGSYSVTSGGDTVYAAGSGGVNGLAPLADPGADSARIDLLFRERAFW